MQAVVGRGTEAYSALALDGAEIQPKPFDLACGRRYRAGLVTRLRLSRDRPALSSPACIPNRSASIRLGSVTRVT